MAGVSRQAITESCKEGLLKPAVSDNNRVDINHPAAATYLTTKGKTLNKKAAKKKSTAKKVAEETVDLDEPVFCPLYEIPKDIMRFRRLTLEDIYRRFGTETRFIDLLNAVKKITDTKEKDLKNAKEQGMLIPKDLVRKHVLGIIEASNARLLNDTPRTAASKLWRLFESGGTVQDAEEELKKLISSQIKSNKDKARNLLGDDRR